MIVTLGAGGKWSEGAARAAHVRLCEKPGQGVRSMNRAR